MKAKHTSTSERPAVEFLPISSAPPECPFLLLGDGLRRHRLDNSIDLVAAFRDGLKLVVYRPAEGGEMLVDAATMRLETACLQGLRDARAERYVEGAIHVRDNLLPEEFHGATMVVSPSAKTGLKGPTLLRCRLWFLLDRVHELSALYDWTRGLKIIVGIGDSAIVQAAQPIYIGRARFVGMADPIPQTLWVVVVRGSRDRVSLVADRYEPKVAKIDHKIGLAAIACGNDWRTFLTQTLGGDLGFFTPLSKGLGTAVRSNDTDGVIIAFTLTLLAKRADRDRIREYDKTWLGRTIRRFRAMDSRVQAARAAARRRLYGE